MFFVLFVCENYGNSKTLVLLGIIFFLSSLSQDYHELWHSMMSICLFTEVKLQWAALVLGDQLSSRPTMGCV